MGEREKRAVLILFVRDLTLTKNCWLGRRSPTNSGDGLSMSSYFHSVRPLVSLIFYGVNFAFSSTSSKDKSVFPRSPGDAVDGSLGKHLMSLDPLSLLLLPDADSSIISTGSDHVFILRVGPGDLPDGTFMTLPVGINFDRLFSTRVFVNTSNLYESIAVDRSQVEAIKVKLTVVDITVVLRLLGSLNCIRVSRLHL